MKAEANGGKGVRSSSIEVDMERYLSKHEIVYLSPPTEGWEAFPMGNGSFGGPLWAIEDGLVFQANHTDTLELPDPQGRNEGWAVLRSCGRLMVQYGVPMHDWLYLNAFTASLSLYRAQTEWSAKTAFGTFRAKFYVHACRPVAVLKVSAHYTGDLEESGSPLRVSIERWGSRVFGWWYAHIHGGASMDLGEVQTSIGGEDICLMASFRGVRVALRCRVIGAKAQPTVVHAHRAELLVEARPVRDLTILVSCVTSHDVPDPLAETELRLDGAAASGDLEGEHLAWWAAYWNRSFLHISQGYFENLYYLHLYLMGSASRGRLPPLFNGGIWIWNRDVRNWVNPHHWNEQQSFWCLPAANRSDFLRPYTDTHARLMDTALEITKDQGYQGLRWNEQHDYTGRPIGLEQASFRDNHTPAAQIAMFYWWHYRYSGDVEYLKKVGFPFIDAVGDFFLGYLTWQEDKGEYEAPLAGTYEDERPLRFVNSITMIAMAKAVFRILIGLSETVGADEEKKQRWQHVLDHLPEYLLNDKDVARGTTLASGLVNGKEVPDKEDHNHGPLFCPVFPAGDLGLANRGSTTFQATCNTLATYPENVLAITPTVVIAARLGMAEEARRRMQNMVRNLQQFPNGLFFNIDHWHYLSRRTKTARIQELPWCGNWAPFQRDYLQDAGCTFEDVRVAPYEPDSVEEHRTDIPTTPFSQMGMESLGSLTAGMQEMLLQSHEGLIRIFPALVDDWGATFTLCAEGGFLVTSSREPYCAPGFLEVFSERGGTCSFMNPWGKGCTVRTNGGAVECSEDRGVVHFISEPEHRYLILPARVDEPEVTTFTGHRNTKPKTYQEATLGKHASY